MIVVRLWGGFGNQLFEYAFAYRLAKMTNESLCLDMSWFSNQKLRKQEILKLNIEYDVSIDKQSDKAILLLQNRVVNVLLRLFPFSLTRLGKKRYYLKESRYRYSKKIDCFSLKNTYLDGYWQCFQYYLDYANEYRKLFDLKNLISKGVKELGNEFRNNNYTAVHIRRGDFPKKKKLFERQIRLPRNYYLKAIRMVKQKCPNTIFVLFSDDVEESTFILEEAKVDYIIPSEKNKLSMLDEWYLMQNCPNMIISNSSFGWWAAFLNSCVSKMVYCPNKYWGNDDIVPPDWMVINF